MTTSTATRTEGVLKLKGAAALREQAHSSLSASSKSGRKIPAGEVANIDDYRANRLSTSGVRLTRAQAWSEIVHFREQMKAEEIKAEKQRVKESVEMADKQAREDVDEAMSALETLREMMDRADPQSSEVAGTDAFAGIEILQAYLEKYAGKLEAALFQLRAWNGLRAGSSRPYGWFNESLVRCSE